MMLSCTSSTVCGRCEVSAGHGSICEHFRSMEVFALYGHFAIRLCIVT